MQKKIQKRYTMAVGYNVKEVDNEEYYFLILFLVRQTI